MLSKRFKTNRNVADVVISQQPLHYANNSHFIMTLRALTPFIPLGQKTCLSRGLNELDSCGMINRSVLTVTKQLRSG